MKPLLTEAELKEIERNRPVEHNRDVECLISDHRRLTEAVRARSHLSIGGRTACGWTQKCITECRAENCLWIECQENAK